MKKVVILRSSGNELANQLWNYVSIYAYAREHNYILENPSFFEYGEYFNIPTTSWFVRIVFFLPFKNYTKRKTAFRRKVWRKFYQWYTTIILWFFHDQTISYANAYNKPFYLPSTKETEGKLKELEQARKNIYIDGWLFRNPVGIEKYRSEIKKYFKPRENIEKKVTVTINELQKKYETVVGVHMRQGDYKTWREGTYFIEQKRVREILNEYISIFKMNISKTCFLITSDGPVNEKYFSELNISVSKDNAVTDLFLLASTNVVIGSNSTFGAFASYYGNVPFIVMQKEPMDWDYYRDKTKFFENKYSTMVHY